MMGTDLPFSHTLVRASAIYGAAKAVQAWLNYIFSWAIWTAHEGFTDLKEAGKTLEIKSRRDGCTSELPKLADWSVLLR